MNRANFGNQITNGMQILSVAGTTAAGWEKGRRQQKLADASSALNNMTEEEVNAVGKMRADKLNEEVRQHLNKTDGMMHLTDEEQQKFGDKKAEGLRSYINGNEEDGETTSVDELVAGIKSTKSPQSESLATSVKRNSDWLIKRNLSRGENGRFVSTKKDKKEGDE